MNKLNLGCGSTWKENYPDYKGLDIVDHGQEYVADIMDLADFKRGNLDWNFDTDAFDEVMANHFLEHFNQDELKHIFLWVHNILKVGGVFRITVPHKDRPEAWYLVHKTFFNEETFKMFDRTGTDSHAEFGKWKVSELVTNNRGNIHVVLEKI